MKFRMVDRVTWWLPRRGIRGVKTVSFEEYSLKSAFGGPARLPETLLVESLLQLGNWLVIASTDFTRMGMVVRIGEIAFEGPLPPGGRLEMDLTVRSFRDDGVTLDGTGVCGGRTIIRGTGCLAVPVELGDYCDADDLRVLWSEIYRPSEEDADAAS